MVRSLEQARANRVQKLQKAGAILTQADECTRLLFEKANQPPTSDIKIIAEMPLDRSTISKVKATFWKHLFKSEQKTIYLQRGRMHQQERQRRKSTTANYFARRQGANF